MENIIRGMPEAAISLQLSDRGSEAALVMQRCVTSHIRDEMSRGETWQVQ